MLNHEITADHFINAVHMKWRFPCGSFMYMFWQGIEDFYAQKMDFPF